MLLGGEPKIVYGLWILVYGFIFFLGMAFLGFIFCKWNELPLSIRFISIIMCCFIFFVYLVLIRCRTGEDCFVFDHPLSVCISDEEYNFSGLFSHCVITSADVKNITYWPISRSWCWVIINIDYCGKQKHLWISPWFRNRVNILDSLSSQVKIELKRRRGGPV